MNSVPKKSKRFTLFIAFLLMALLIQPSLTVPIQAAPPSISTYSLTPFQETEPNNTRSQADLVNSSYFGKPYYSLFGAISIASTDVDYYRIDTIISGEFMLNGKWIGPLTGQNLEHNLSIRLENASGNILKTSNLYSSYPFYEQGMSVIIPVGTYYLRIASGSEQHI